MRNVTVDELNTKLDEINVIDIREKYERKSGYVRTSQHIPLLKLVRNHGKYLNQLEEYYIICESGSRSLQAVEYLSNFGYNVINVIGGTGLYRIKYQLEVA